MAEPSDYRKIGKKTIAVRWSDSQHEVSNEEILLTDFIEKIVIKLE